MGKIGFYINHGVEVRYFLLSGLADLYKGTDEVCLYVHDNHSEVLKEYSLKYNVVVKVLPEINVNKSSFERFQRAFTNARKRANDVAIYNHFGLLSSPKFYDIFFKIPFIIRIGNFFFRQKAIRDYKNEKLISFFKKENLSKLYLLQYDSTLLKLVGINGALSGADIVVYVNTLKALFIDDFVIFPIDKLFSWNKSQNVLFQKANDGISSVKFIPKGSPYHNFLRIEDEINCEIVTLKYGLDVRRPIIVYSLINEKVFDKEHLIIEIISKHLNDNFTIENRPQLIIRRNPFERDCRHIHFLNSIKNVIIADHYWERDEQKEWSIQSLEGEIEWRALLQVANLNMNIPSMSTIDALMCSTPVLNIAFSESGGYNKSLDFIIESPFNKDFEKCKFVKTARDFKEFSNYFEIMLAVKSSVGKNEIINSFDISTASIQEFK